MSYAVSAPAPAAELGGRLFTTPQQRQKLDELRAQAARTGSPEMAEEQAEIAETAAAAPPPPGFHVNGVVARRQGPDTAWINDVSSVEMDSAAQVLKAEVIEPDVGAVRLTMPDQDQGRTVRVGETLEPQQETIVDLIDPYSNPAAPARARARVDSAAGPGAESDER
jgi:hypothetical protein